MNLNPRKIVMYSLHGILCHFVIVQAVCAQAMDSLTYKLAYIAVNRDMPALKVGSTLPEISEKIVQYEKQTIGTGDLKGKLVILDFWHQWCSSCLAAMPKMERLQKRFGDSILILPVTYQSRDMVERFLKKRKERGIGIGLPSIVEDTLLRKMFPHDGDPHEVWIDGTGAVRAITGSEAVTEATVAGFLEHDSPVGLKTRRDQEYINYNSKPLMGGSEIAVDSIFSYHSIITRYNDTLSGGTIDSTGNMIRISVINRTPREMYNIAYSNYYRNLDRQFNYFVRRTIVKTRDVSKFSVVNGTPTEDYSELQKFYRDNYYCYELIVPAGFSLRQAFGMMIQDLDRYFKIHSTVKKMPVEGFVLTPGPRLEAAKRVKTDEDRGYIIELKQQPLEKFVGYINSESDLPIVKSPAENIKGDVYFDLRDMHDEKAIRKAFLENGWDLKKGNFDQEMLILSDREN